VSAWRSPDSIAERLDKSALRCAPFSFYSPSVECLLEAGPFAPALGIAIALLLIRSTLSQVDVPARIVCNGCSHSARTPCSNKHHSGASKLRRGGQSSPCGPLARASSFACPL
jgi:hypothetical protein